MEKVEIILNFFIKFTVLISKNYFDNQAITFSVFTAVYVKIRLKIKYFRDLICEISVFKVDRTSKMKGLSMFVCLRKVFIVDVPFSEKNR